MKELKLFKLLKEALNAFFIFHLLKHMYMYL